MNIQRYITGLLFALMLAGFPVWAQPDPIRSLARTTRVAVLPFVNYAEAPDVMPRVMHLVQVELDHRGVIIADADSMADALRSLRIRNTIELSTDQIQGLAKELSATYILVGALERYVQGEENAETAISARLIHVPTLSPEWVGTAEQHTLNGVRVLDLGREPRAVMQIERTVQELFKDFRFKWPDLQGTVQSVRLWKGAQSFRQSCERIVVLPFGNETDSHNAGGIVSNHMIAVLDRSGYRVVEPGLAREAMLEAGDVTPGRASVDLLRVCREKFSAGLVLTGTVSEFRCGGPLSLNESPEVAIEARLIDAYSGQVVWAKSFRGNGEDSEILFGTGTSYSAADVAEHVAGKLIKAIAVYRTPKS